MFYSIKFDGKKMAIRFLYFWGETEYTKHNKQTGAVISLRKVSMSSIINTKVINSANQAVNSLIRCNAEHPAGHNTTHPTLRRSIHLHSDKEIK